MRGKLTQRGADRVARLSWTLADLAGLDAPGRDEVHRGARPARRPVRRRPQAPPGADRMSGDAQIAGRRRERAARMVLSGVVEPGDVDACRLVREHGARCAARAASLACGCRGQARRLGAAAGRHVARRGASGRRRGGRALRLCPGDEEWPRQLDELRLLESADGAATHRRTRSASGCADQRSSVDRRPVGVDRRRPGIDGVRRPRGRRSGVPLRRPRLDDRLRRRLRDRRRRASWRAGRRHPTVAVLAGGIDRLYPAGNANLLRRSSRTGVLVAEAGPGCKPIKSRFLTRNRLIAALGAGIVVVEAALRSGALSSARWALDLGRPVMGVRGRSPRARRVAFTSCCDSRSRWSSPMSTRCWSTCRRWAPTWPLARASRSVRSTGSIRSSEQSWRRCRCSPR